MRDFSIVLIILGVLISAAGRVYRNSAYFKARKDPEKWKTARPVARKIFYAGVIVTLLGVCLLFTV